MSTAIVAAASALLGVSLGALLSRRNEKRAQADRLLVDALNDAVAAIADVAQTQGREAQARYGSAVGGSHYTPHPLWSRLSAAFKTMQTPSPRMAAHGCAAVQVARHELGHESADEGDLGVLLFGPRGTSETP